MYSIKLGKILRFPSNLAPLLLFQEKSHKIKIDVYTGSTFQVAVSNAVT